MKHWSKRRPSVGSRWAKKQTNLLDQQKTTSWTPIGQETDKPTYRQPTFLLYLLLSIAYLFTLSGVIDTTNNMFGQFKFLTTILYKLGKYFEGLIIANLYRPRKSEKTSRRKTISYYTAVITAIHIVSSHFITKREGWSA